jgi:hypothetical protein
MSGTEPQDIATSPHTHPTARHIVVPAAPTVTYAREATFL